MKKHLLLWVFALLSFFVMAQQNALHFDGVDDFIKGSSSPSLEISDGTVELWVKPQSKPSSQTFLCYRNDSGFKTKYLWNFLGNLSGIGFWNGSFYITISHTFNSGQWYHLAFVGESTQTKVYADGNYIGAFIIPFGTATGNDLNLVLGNDIPGSEFFFGEMDEVRIWNRQLCEEEINNQMNCELSGNEQGLITYYNFNQGIAGGNNSSNTSLTDNGSANINGTLNNFSLSGNQSNWVSATNVVSGSCTPVICPPSHTIQVHYLITSDYAFVQAEYDEVIRSMQEIQGWYQAQTGGKTFQILNPSNPIIANLPNTSSYYNVDYWGRIITDMTDLGHFPYNSGKVNIYFIKGGGGLALGAQGCGSDCGLAMFGMDIYPQFNTGQFFTCPDAPGGGAAWPCTPLGAATHELGHCFGLPHPIDVSATSSVANHSVMQTHWNYPFNFAPSAESPWGLLSLERQTLITNPFFFDDILLSQKNENLPIVNLPNTGAIPTANFSYSITGNTVFFSNSSISNIDNYWTFGDESVAHSSSPSHTFNDLSEYTVRLRVRAANGMMHMKEEVIVLNSPLPLDLIEFRVQKADEGIQLNWKTENEYDFSHFEIFKSVDGMEWKNIKRIPSQQELSNTYSYIDKAESILGATYYKLKIIDNDESYSWSPVRVVHTNSEAAIQLFPNPVKSGQRFSIVYPDNQTVSSIIIEDIKGPIVQKHLSPNLESNPVIIETNLNSGVYLIRLRTITNSVFYKKLIVID